MDHSGEVPGVLSLLWQERTPPRRGPRPTLTLDAIAQVGIEIADAEGLGAVTMQRVAERLGVTKMALYRYVPGKAELVALMTERALDTPPEPTSPTSHWRTRLTEWAHEVFARFLRHPWALETTVGARSVGPNELAWTEAALAALTGLALDGGEMLDVVATVVGHVRGIAIQTVANANTEQALAATITMALQRYPERYPALARALRSATEHGAQDQALDFGLQRILDGVELLVTRRAADDSGPATKPAGR